MVQAIRDTANPLGLSDQLRTYLSKVLTNDIHPNDRKWRSIVQMRDFPEFDMIIDTYGEITYSEPARLADDPELFNLTIRAALSKLLPDGDLYVASMPTIFRNHSFEEYVPGHGEEFTTTQEESRLNVKKDGLSSAYTIHRAGVSPNSEKSFIESWNES